MRLKIETGKKKRPQRVTIYTPEGFGKSTFGAGYPAPLFLDTEEGGTDHLDVPRVAIRSYSDAQEAVEFLKGGDHNFRTVVIDTIDWLEKRIADHICAEAKVASIESFGFGKGYVHLAEEFGRFLLSLDELIAKGMNVLVLAHSHMKSFTPPDSSQGYDRYELKLSKQTAPMLKEWSDALLFGNFKVRVQDRDGGKARGVGGTERQLHCEHCAAWDAKNRVGLEGAIPFTHAAISELIIDAPIEKEEPKTASIDERVAIVNQLAEGFVKRALEERLVTEFLVGRDVIKKGDKWHAAPLEYLQRISERVDTFVDTVRGSLETESKGAA